MNLKQLMFTFVIMCAVVGLVLVFAPFGGSVESVGDISILSDSKEENEAVINCFAEKLEEEFS